MKKNIKILALIPARGGSKTIPNKNILKINKKPLIYYTINQAKKSRYITNVTVSSDSEKILSISKKYGVKTIKRPKKIAADNSPTELAVKHTLDYYKKRNIFFDYLILLQPTSPLRTVKNINESIEKILSKNATTLISVYRPEHSPFKSFILEKNGSLKGLINNKYPFLSRQLLPDAYYPNGAIFIVNTNFFNKTNKLISNKCLPYIMKKENSVDIDSFQDINLLNEKFLKIQ